MPFEIVKDFLVSRGVWEQAVGGVIAAAVCGLAALVWRALRQKKDRDKPPGRQTIIIERPETVNIYYYPRRCSSISCAGGAAAICGGTAIL